MWENIKRKAANIGEPNTTLYTVEDFLTFMPQFFKKEEKEDIKGNKYNTYTCLVPEEVLNNFISMVNDTILESRWFSKRKYASSLYVAHFCTLYLQTYNPEGSQNIQEAVQGANRGGLIASTSLGDSTISFDNSILAASLNKYGSWSMTTYGQQLVQEAKALGIGGGFYI